MKPVEIAALAFVAAFAGVLGFQYLPAMPKAGVAPAAYVPPPIAKPVTTTICDDRATVETVKQLALSKIKKDALRHLPEDQTILMVALNRPASLTLSGFRDRGKIGAGTVCAALITIHLDLDTRYGPAELSTEYTVEPTTDGKVMVSARFMPN